MTEKIITIPELSFVVLVGASGSGKSSFASKHFKPTEILSSDVFRGLVSDDENNQDCSDDAFDALYYLAATRMRRGKLTVVDATNINPQDRANLVRLAREHYVLPVAIVFDLPWQTCHERNQERANRQFGRHVVMRHTSQLRRGLRSIKRDEGFTQVHLLKDVAAIDQVKIVRHPLWNNKKQEEGPFDIIGDVHGCFDELATLVTTLGYQISKQDDRYCISHPENRKLVFVGDLVDRGPKITEVLRFAMQTVEDGSAFCVVGNHDDKLKRALLGKKVKIASGLQESLDQLAQESAEFRDQVQQFLHKLISHYVFDQGKLAVAHAGIKEPFIGRGAPSIKAFCMYGETTGEIDEFGLPVRYPWVKDYRGDTLVVYGHTPVPEPEWINNTLNVDTGCVFGGHLTALRYPEKDIVAVPAKRMYVEPIKPIESEDSGRLPHTLNIADISGKRFINTSLQRTITLHEDQSAAALEVMTRFGIDPRWMIYLPPTMSPTETSQLDQILEHPEEAFAYYRRNGIGQVICEEKHMGSRAIVIVCKNKTVAAKRFHVEDGLSGVCYTRTGRAFFKDPAIEARLIQRLNKAIKVSGLWETLATDWMILDCEIMPWSAKAQSLLQQQYAPVAAAGEATLTLATQLFAQTAERIAAVDALKTKYEHRLEQIKQYREAYRGYCWPIKSINDYQIAPFHLLAHENSLNMHRDHLWHMEQIASLCEADPRLLKRTQFRVVEVDDPNQCQEAVNWWQAMLDQGGEGMVVKPVDFTVKGDHGLVQPGVKCRGREYLRIIYGPEYTTPENLQRLRRRGLGKKRSLALREYVLGYDALKYFVEKKPLYKTHECVFGVLALETEPVDPRL